MSTNTAVELNEILDFSLEFWKDMYLKRKALYKIMREHVAILTILSIFILLLCGALSGCTNNTHTIVKDERTRFIGTWILKINNSDIGTLILDSNSTCVYTIQGSTLNGTWNISNGTFTNTFFQHPRTFTYSFSDNDTTLTLTATDNGEVIVFKKKGQ